MPAKKCPTKAATIGFVRTSLIWKLKFSAKIKQVSSVATDYMLVQWVALAIFFLVVVYHSDCRLLNFLGAKVYAASERPRTSG
jgi:hypothetical protein